MAGTFGNVVYQHLLKSVRVKLVIDLLKWINFETEFQRKSVTFLY